MAGGLTAAVFSIALKGEIQALISSPPITWVVSLLAVAWALAIAIVCVIASFVLPRHAGESAPGADAVLLNQVDAQVSRTAPSSMEPLMKLVVQE